jgi:hypothetical protein
MALNKFSNFFQVKKAFSLNLKTCVIKRLTLIAHLSLGLINFVFFAQEDIMEGKGKR